MADANTSLVLPALILLLGAYVVFKDNGEERARLTQALIQERADIASQNQKLLDRYDLQLQAIEQHLAAEAKHFQELYETEAGVFKGRLDRAAERGDGNSSVKNAATAPQAPK